MGRRSLALTAVALLAHQSAAAGAQRGEPSERPLPGPRVVIGREGDPDYEFARIRQSLPLGGGRVVVADAGTRELRLFGPDGALLRKLGRDGEGPGEFRAINRVMVFGDTVVAYDVPLRRLTAYRDDGTLVRTVRIEPAGVEEGVEVIGRLGDGRWLVQTLYGPSWRHGHGAYRDTVGVGALPASGSGPVAWIDRRPGVTFFAFMPEGDQAAWRVGLLPLTPTLMATAWRDTLLIGDSSRPELLFVTPAGHVARRIRLPLHATASPLAVVAAHRREALPQARDQGQRRFLEAAFDAATGQPALPLWARLVTDGDDAIWIQAADPAPDSPARYVVVDRAGRLLSRWRLPPRSRLLFAESGRVGVVLEDDAGIQRIGLVDMPRR